MQAMGGGDSVDTWNRVMGEYWGLGECGGKAKGWGQLGLGVGTSLLKTMQPEGMGLKVEERGSLGESHVWVGGDGE